MTASKAELHAVMASLTYKDRMAVTNESISSAIEKIFEGNRHGHNSAKLSQDVERFLSNPYESIAALVCLLHSFYSLLSFYCIVTTQLIELERWKPYTKKRN